MIGGYQIINISSYLNGQDVATGYEALLEQKYADILTKCKTPIFATFNNIPLVPGVNLNLSGILNRSEFSGHISFYGRFFVDIIEEAVIINVKIANIPLVGMAIKFELEGL